jgi:hypothetical protein
MIITSLTMKSQLEDPNLIGYLVPTERQQNSKISRYTWEAVRMNSDEDIPQLEDLDISNGTAPARRHQVLRFQKMALEL